MEKLHHSGRHPIRARIGGVAHDFDATYLVTDPGDPAFEGGFSEYNGEIMGCTKEMADICRGTSLFAFRECERLGLRVRRVVDDATHPCLHRVT